MCLSLVHRHAGGWLFLTQFKPFVFRLCSPLGEIFFSFLAKNLTSAIFLGEVENPFCPHKKNPVNENIQCALSNELEIFWSLGCGFGERVSQHGQFPISWWRICQLSPWSWGWCLDGLFLSCLGSGVLWNHLCHLFPPYHNL